MKEYNFDVRWEDDFDKENEEESRAHHITAPPVSAYVTPETPSHNRGCEESYSKFPVGKEALSGDSLSFYLPPIEGEDVGHERLIRWLKYVSWETDRVYFEKYLAAIPGMNVARVDVEEDDGTVVVGANTKVEWILDKNFFDVLNFIRRNTRGNNRDILANIEAIAPIVEDVRKGRKSIKEIEDDWSLKGNLKVIKREKEKPKGKVHKKQLIKEEEFKLEKLAEGREQLEDKVISSGKEPDKEPVPKPNYINLIMFKKNRKKRGKKDDRKGSHDPS